MNEQQPTPEQAQIQIGGGLIPQPNGQFIAQMWFSGLPNEQTARQFMVQLDGVIKQMFSAPPPQQQPQPAQPNGPLP